MSAESLAKQKFLAGEPHTALNLYLDLYLGSQKCSICGIYQMFLLMMHVQPCNYRTCVRFTLFRPQTSLKYKPHNIKVIPQKFKEIPTV